MDEFDSVDISKYKGSLAVVPGSRRYEVSGEKQKIPEEHYLVVRARFGRSGFRTSSYLVPRSGPCSCSGFQFRSDCIHMKAVNYVLREGIDESIVLVELDNPADCK